MRCPAFRRSRMPSATDLSVVAQKGGSAARRNPPYRAVASRESSTATMPRSPAARISRPAPCASRTAAWVAETLIKPLPPAFATARVRAVISGSSGRGNGIRSITTSLQASPGTSTPCHRDMVPNRQVASSSANSFTSADIEDSPWHRMGKSTLSRSAAAASSAARRDENRPSAAPPDAFSSASSSASCAGEVPRSGLGRSFATYRTPCRG